MFIVVLSSLLSIVAIVVGIATVFVVVVRGHYFFPKQHGVLAYRVKRPRSLCHRSNARGRPAVDASSTRRSQCKIQCLGTGELDKPNFC